MGRRYVFDADPADPTMRDRVEAAAVAAKLSPRILESAMQVELMVDGAHDGDAIRAFERNLPAGPSLVEPVPDGAPSLLGPDHVIDQISSLVGVARVDVIRSVIDLKDQAASITLERDVLQKAMSDLDSEKKSLQAEIIALRATAEVDEAVRAELQLRLDTANVQVEGLSGEIEAAKIAETTIYESSWKAPRGTSFMEADGLFRPLVISGVFEWDPGSEIITVRSVDGWDMTVPVSAGWDLIVIQPAG